MVNNLNRIKAEINQLEEILADLREDAVIERSGYEYRLNELRTKLKHTPSTPTPKTFDLTFQGEPVNDTSAIAAGFASKATDLFADAFDMIVASLSGNLGEASSGPVAGKNKYGLLINNIALGSFGFQFQLPQETHQHPENSSVSEKAIHIIENIFRVAAEEDDENIADAIDEIPPRAIKKIHSFLEQLEKNKAWCGLNFDKHKFQFKNLEQLSQAAAHLKEDNITETEQYYNGRLIGLLPASKVFEFKISDTNKTIKGKISPELKEIESLAQEWLFKESTIHLKSVTLGKGSPRYTLIALKAHSDD